jgi:hypothetical protein
MRTKVQKSHLIPVNPQNATSKDWVILLEAGTIIGPSPERLRVARSTLERKIVKKYNFMLKAKYFLVLEGHDPRIHAVFFCPQLYKYDSEKKLVPLHGDEIGKLIAHAVEGGITERRPWYNPSEKLPDRPIIEALMNTEFDTLVVDMPSAERA